MLLRSFRQASTPLAEQRRVVKYNVDPDELGLLRQYAETTDARVLVARHGVAPRMVRLLNRSLANHDEFYNTDGPRVKNLDVLARRVFSHLGIVPDELDRLKPMTDEIQHYKNIVIELRDIAELAEKVAAVRDYRDPEAEEQELDALLDAKKISREEYKKRLKAAARRQPGAEFTHNGHTLNIEAIANHYYIPVLLAGDERVEFIKHAIRHKSEVQFVRDLQQHLDAFSGFDWWMFSKVDESLDSVWIPWYDVKPHKFYPDFVFWLQKGSRYVIAFVDPKGTEHTQLMRKLDGYRMLFEEDDAPKPIRHNGLTVIITTLMYPRDVALVAESYRRHCVDSVTGLAKQLQSLI